MLEQETIREREGRWKPRPTLSGSDYTSPEVWEEERERIWFGDWVCIGRAEEVADPGDYLVRDLVGESIFITRNAQGELHGFYNCARIEGRSSSMTSLRRATCGRPSSARTTPGPTTWTGG